MESEREGAEREFEMREGRLVDNVDTLSTCLGAGLRTVQACQALKGTMISCTGCRKPSCNDPWV